MIIQVTQKHIDEACINRDSPGFNECEDCMVATALKEVFPDSKISCGFCGLTIGYSDYSLPEFVSKNICDFMAGLEVKPFEFHIGRPW